MTGVQTFADPHSVASLLGWWRDAGVDALVDEHPRAWLSGLTPTPELPAPEQNRLPETLAGFAEWFANSTDVPGAGPAQRRLAATGNPASPIMVIVDMPEAQDVSEARLLGGDAGRLFDRMLAAIGLDRTGIYLAPLSPGRPVSGQIESAHIARLGQIARHHASLVRPKRLWLLGQATNSAVLGIDAAAARGRLHFINHDGCNMEAVGSLHPRLLLQNPARKAGTWADMQVLLRGL